MGEQVVPNVDVLELQKFDAVASLWWDPKGPFRALHDLNPARLKYIQDRCQIESSRVLDVGCGGGILAEAMAYAGAEVVAIDIAPRVLDVAKLHLAESGLEVDYRRASVEQLAAETPGEFDVVTCMEMLEHVPNPMSVISSIAQLLKPGGRVFLSTLNRTPWSFLLGIVGAEYVARILPQGTHRYDRFIRPSELGSWLRAADLNLQEVCGLHYNPVAGTAKMGGHVNVNFLAHALRQVG